MSPQDFFEVKTCDLAGRIGNLRTKTSQFETPALLPVIHPLHQMIPCSEIQKIGYSAVMTNAYTAFSKRMEDDHRTIHEIIGFNGSVMTDSGGYQVLEFGSVEVTPEQIASFEESIGSDIAVILDKPTGLNVTRRIARETVDQTIAAAKATKRSLTRGDVIWTLPIQGGKYLDLVRKSARQSALLAYDCFALGSPVEVMEEYDFSLLVKMIISAKTELPESKPFHLFGAGHPLVLPLAVALGCDMFDSASYILYAKKDRYISQSGTTRLEQLEYLDCVCDVCSSFTARELRATKKEDRIMLIARHNLAILRRTMLEIKQAIWEGRLWELIESNSRKHPRALEAFKSILGAYGSEGFFESGTPRFKDRGIFVYDETDFVRSEVRRHRDFFGRLDVSKKTRLLILPETKTKPFLRSDIFEEVLKIVSAKGDFEKTMISFVCSNFGLIPAEISDIYPLSQIMSATESYPSKDRLLNSKKWESISLLVTDDAREKWGRWITRELANFYGVLEDSIKISLSPKAPNPKMKGTVQGAKSYRAFKKMIQVV